MTAALLDVLERLADRIERLEGRLALMSDSDGVLRACAREEAGSRMRITSVVDAFRLSGREAAEVVDLLGYQEVSWQSAALRHGFLWRTRLEGNERRYWIVRKPA